MVRDRLIRRELIKGQSTIPLPPLEQWTELPLVSLLVAAWNEEAYLPDFLASFCALTYPHKELILCAGGTDGTYLLAQSWVDCPVIVLMQEPGEGKFRALQRCLAQAHGSIIFLTDADCVLNDESFQRCIYPVASGTETVVTGGFQPLTKQLRQPLIAAQWMMEEGRRLQAAAQASYSPFLVGANCAVARPTIEACWQNTLANPIGEDYYLALQIQRIGQSIRHCPESRVQTRYPATFGAYVLRKSRWHRSWLLHHYHLGDRRWARNLLSAARFQMLLVLPLLSLFFGPLGIAIWGWHFWAYWQHKRLVENACMNDIVTVRIHHLLQLMVADFCAWAYGFSPYWQSHMSIYRAKTEPQSNLCYKFVLMLAAYYAWAITPFELGISKLKNRW